MSGGHGPRARSRPLRMTNWTHAALVVRGGLIVGVVVVAVRGVAVRGRWRGE